MGLDPNDGSYPHLDQCPLCQDVIFNGVTPEYVVAVVKDVSICPGAPPMVYSPNGAWSLHKQPGVCAWKGGDGTLAFSWVLDLNFSRMAIYFDLGTMFWEKPLQICIDFFSNTVICNGGMWGTGGTVRIFWGPTLQNVL